MYSVHRTESYTVEQKTSYDVNIFIQSEALLNKVL